MEHSLYQQAHQLIGDSSLGRVAEQLKSFLKLGICMESSLSLTHPLLLGESRLGGLPDLPPTFTWPTWKEVPMVFLAQVALQDVASYDIEHLLPSRGYLYFFCQSQNLFQGVNVSVWDYIDTEEPESWRVLFFDGNRDDLLTVMPPDGLPRHALLTGCRLHFWSALMLPPLESILIASLHLNQEEIKKYLELLAVFEDVFSEENAYHHHRLLGYPVQLQDDMQLLCHLSSTHIAYEQWVRLDEETKSTIETEVLEWLHLFQIDTDEHVQVTWGESGSLSYWIKQADLRRQNFIGCWAIGDSL